MRVRNITLEQISEDLWAGSLPGILVTIEMNSGRWTGRIKSLSFNALVSSQTASTPEYVRALIELELDAMLNVMRAVCEEES